jgi:hypothetical protein
VIYPNQRKWILALSLHFLASLNGLHWFLLDRVLPKNRAFLVKIF